MNKLAMYKEAIYKRATRVANPYIFRGPASNEDPESYSARLQGMYDKGEKIKNTANIASLGIGAGALATSILSGRGASKRLKQLADSGKLDALALKIKKSVPETKQILSRAIGRRIGLSAGAGIGGVPAMMLTEGIGRTLANKSTLRSMTPDERQRYNDVTKIRHNGI